MPGNGFTLAVRVGREKDVVGLGRLLAQSREQIALAADRDVLRFIVVFRVDTHAALRQVAHVPVRRGDIIAVAQKPFDCLDLGGGFDDYQILLCCCSHNLFLSRRAGGLIHTAMFRRTI